MAATGTIRKDVLRNRARLLAAADELIAARGLDVSFNALARHAGMGVGTVYRHFADPAALVDALLERRLDAVTALLRGALEVADPVDALRAAITGLCELQARDRGVLQLLNAPPERWGAAVRERLAPWLALLAGRVHAAERMRPAFASDDVLTIVWLAGVIDERAGTAARRRYVDVMLAGFLADGEPRPPLAAP